MNSGDVLAHYQRILHASEQMLAAATESRWDDLVALETARRSLVDQMAVAPPRLGAASNEQKKAIIERILQIDEQVRALTQTWMSELQGILTSVQAQRKLNKVYEAR
jgi:flagellar protein FliT